MRLILAVAFAALVASGCVATSQTRQAPDPGIQANTIAESIHAEEVCFEGENRPLDGDRIFNLRGTLFHPSSPAETILVLTHGTVWSRELFAGAGLGQDREQTSFAHLLAKAGYAVLTWDRLGYGDSTYMPLTGWELTYGGDADRLHGMVKQLRAGTYKDETCTPKGEPRAKFLNVILVGWDGGGLAVMGYAVRYSDVEAVVPMGFPLGGPSATFWAQHAVACAPPHPLAPNGYAYFFCLGPEGVSRMCVDLLFHAPGMQDMEAVRHLCRNQNIGTEPNGNLDLELIAEIEALATQVRVPTLFVYPEFSGTMNEGPDQDGRASEQRTIAQWRALSQSTVDAIHLPGTGHALTLHETRYGLVDEIAEWLRARLAAHAGP